MFVLDNLLTAPGKAVYFLLKELARKAQEEWLDDDAVKQELQELYVLMDSGAVSDKEFELREIQLVERLQQIARVKLEGGNWIGAASDQQDVDQPPTPPLDAVPAIGDDAPEQALPLANLAEALQPLLEMVAAGPGLSPVSTDRAWTVELPLIEAGASVRPLMPSNTEAVVPGAVGLPPPACAPLTQFSPPLPGAPVGLTVPEFESSYVPKPTAMPPVIPIGPPGAPPSSGLTLGQVVDSALRGLSILRMKVSSVTSVSRADQGWQVIAELVERRAVPDTSDLLGVYELRLDEGGNLLRWQRTRMRRRCDLGS